jgi:hypothetical protein
MVVVTVQEAVADPVWQAFRREMKGRSTARKLHDLHEYYVDMSRDYLTSLDDVKWAAVRVQVDNYIKALCRGGQLYPGESLQTALDNGWDLRIKS